MKTKDKPLRTVFKLHRKIHREEGNIQDMSLGPCDQQGRLASVMIDVR